MDEKKPVLPKQFSALVQKLPFPKKLQRILIAAFTKGFDRNNYHYGVKLHQVELDYVAG